MTDERTLERIEVVADLTAESRCDEGFLTVRRLRLRNVYDDGTVSETYPCDVVSRRFSDAVAAVLYETGPQGQVYVLLREAPRAPVYLRETKKAVRGGTGEHLLLEELVAGMVEEQDPPGNAGLQERMATEVREESGLTIEASRFSPLGSETFASPGTSDERILFFCADARLSEADSPPGDGSTMEEHAHIRVRELREAIRACRRGEIPDMKTEVGLLRLADYLGYIPQLGLYEHQLTPGQRSAYTCLGSAATDDD